MNGQECKCQYIHTNHLGTYDTVTKEWLADTKTTHVGMKVNPMCPIHWRLNPRIEHDGG